MPPRQHRIAVDPASDTPLYRQIVDALRVALVEGVFPAGTQLPTVRELAIELNVHHNTVAEAYRSLAAEDWLLLGGRRGAIVRARQPKAPSGGSEERALRQRMRSAVAEAKSSGLSTAAIVRALEETLRHVKETL